MFEVISLVASGTKNGNFHLNSPTDVRMFDQFSILIDSYRSHLNTKMAKSYAKICQRSLNDLEFVFA